MKKAKRKVKVKRKKTIRVLKVSHPLSNEIVLLNNERRILHEELETRQRRIRALELENTRLQTINQTVRATMEVFSPGRFDAMMCPCGKDHSNDKTELDTIMTHKAIADGTYKEASDGAHC
jgi:hypothetical protein